MKLALDNKYGSNLIGAKSSAAKTSSPSFKGLQSRVSNIITKEGSAVVSSIQESSFIYRLRNFVKNNIVQGTDVTYKNQSGILDELSHQFGSTFDECLININKYNRLANSKKQLQYTIDQSKDTITFHKDSFVKNVIRGAKEFTVGTFMDIAIGIRKGMRKLSGEHPKIHTSGFLGKINDVLDNRITEQTARDSFWRLSGVFDRVTERFSGHYISKNDIHDSVSRLAKESVEYASKKVGNYNTKTERAFNRLGTGFVSASFAATDFYNISMLQNNDTEKANASGKKRFWQDMRRQFLTAGLTYILLGAFQNKVNKSMAYAVLSLGGVTLISEIVSRMMGGISLTPLSPEEAAMAAEKKAKKSLLEKKKKNKTEKPQAEIKTPEIQTGIIKQPSRNIDTSKGDDVFNAFIKAAGGVDLNKDVNFTSNKNLEQDKKPDSKTTKPDENDNKKKHIGKNILKFLGAAVGLSLAVGFLRTKNFCGIDDGIKEIGERYRNFIDSHTTKRLILSKVDVDGFMNYLEVNGFGKQKQTLLNKLNLEDKHKIINGKSKLVRKALGKNANPDELYYNLGFVDDKFKKASFNVIMYPINTIGKLIQGGNNLIRSLMGAGIPKAGTTTIRQAMPSANFMEKYVTKYSKAIREGGDLMKFSQDMNQAFSRHFSEAASKNKNTSLAMLSRLLITFISGYFFVNDYRNEVLISSKGQDVERANATAKERIMHKVTNFFFNSMFMDLFNTTFENIYLGSVLGATGVAMATEVTNESMVRASICTPKVKMNRDQLIEYENKRLNDEGLSGKYYRAFMKLTGKKPLSEKAKKN